MGNLCRGFLFVCAVTIFFFNSSTVKAQVQGSLNAVPLGSSSAPYGYYEYLPQGYSPTDSKKWPLIIFLHGVGEVGNGGSQLSTILRTGLPQVIQKGKNLPFVVIMPQATFQWWDVNAIDQLYEYVKVKYKIDPNRFYLTGLSLGGIGTWQYTTYFPQKVAAMVSISGNGGGGYLCTITDIPIWDFHGDADPTVVIQGDIDAINTVNTQCKVSPKAKLTVYPGVGHNCWDRTYDGTGMGTESKAYDPFKMDIYSWLLQYSKGGTVQPPPVSISANAGTDKTITLPTSTLTLSGSGTSTGGNISSYAWSKISGPAATLSGQTTGTLNLSGLLAGSYTFELKVTDVAGNTAVDDVIVTVQSAPVVTIQANAGADKSITLPTNTVTLSGTGTSSAGSISSYAWTKASGSTATLAGQNTATLSLSALVEGSYTFQLKITDVAGNSAVDNVNVTVLKAPVVTITANAGADKSITLPANTVTLSGTGTSSAGSISSYAWTKTSGSTATLAGQNTATLSLSSLVEGSYIFQLKVTDVAGNSAVDNVNVTVQKGLANSNNLVGEWKLDNDASDNSGNSINGTLMNAPVFAADHKEGTGALSFNGTNQYVDIKPTSLFPTGTAPRTLSLWAKANDVTTGVYRWAASFGSAGVSGAMFIGQNGTTLDGGGYGSDITVANFWKVNVWHHLCLTYDGTTAKLYADGTLLTSAAKTWSLVLANASIGRQVNGGEYWNGSVDDVRIYNKALSASEVQTLAAGTVATTPPNTSGLVGEWNLENNANDISGSGINGTAVNGPVYTTDHKEGNSSIQFNGTNQYIDLKNPSQLPAAKAPRSMSLWAKTNDVSASYRWAAAYGSPTPSQAMFIGQNGVKLYGGGYVDDLVVDNFWKVNEWHHLCLTYDGTTAKLYADGTLVSSGTKNWNLVLAYAYIGRQVNNAEYWNGTVDDVRIYNKALSASDVQALATTTSLQKVITSLAAEWDLDNNVNDVSGNSHAGTIINGASFTSDHQEGSGALAFNGTNQYVDVSNATSLPSGLSARTMTLWAKTNSIASGYRWAASYGKAAASSAMFIGQNGTTLDVGGFSNDVTVANFWKVNEWHHICITYDGTTAKLYADGALITSAAKTWNLVTEYAFIGRQVNKGEYWNGVVDDVQIYSKALSLAEIQALYQASSSTSARVAEPDAENITTDVKTVGEQGEGQNFVLYPNPAQRSISLNIKADALPEGDEASIIIYDMTGKPVKKVEGLTQESSPTDIEELSDGVYIATIVVRGRTVDRQRFIKATR